ncbi:heterokaryon incompatibility protein-domain-containing protein [Xylaria scruposa]|nr:heterokaryon incompatibility protein-domain-containing protein [Xylaria scruposa]
MDNNQYYYYEVQTNKNEQTIFFRDDERRRMWERELSRELESSQGHKRRRSENIRDDWLERKAQRRRDACCIKCREMTGTLEGLLALVGDGYEHYNYYQIQQSADMGCQLCELIWDLTEGEEWAKDWIFDDSESTVITYDKIVVRAVSDRDSDSLCTTPESAAGSDDEELARARAVLEKSGGAINPEFRISNLRVDIPRDGCDGFSDDAPLLHLVTYEDNPAAKYVPGRWQAKTLTPEVVGEVIEWLNECQDKHESYMKRRDQVLPRRVIDVGSEGNSADIPKLHVSDHGEKGEYAALSYCWGHDPQVMTTIATLSSYVNGLPPNISNTIKDAITVCRKLGTRFLWVDALCIIQDDGEDKADQLAAMGAIYKQAHYTIAAAGASKVSEGFLADTTPNEGARHIFASLPLYIDESTSGNIYIREQSLRFVDPQDEQPLFYRAWTLQEMLLSPRVLVFDSHQLMLKCHKRWFNPVGPKTYLSYEEYYGPDMPAAIFGGASELSDFNAGGSASNKPLSSVWSSIVEEYSRRDLSFFTDRLPALAGIASELSAIYGERYLAGFWETSIVRHLGWTRSVNFLQHSPLFNGISDKEPAGVPSWSWASMPFPVTLNDVCKTEARVLGCDIQPVYHNMPYGQIQRAVLVLEALVFTLSQTTSDPPICLGRNQCSCSVNSPAWKCSQPTFLPIGVISVDFREEVGSEGVRLVLLGYNKQSEAIFLLVKPTTNEYFCRIGYAKLSDARKRIEAFSTSRKKEVIFLV